VETWGHGARSANGAAQETDVPPLTRLTNFFRQPTPVLRPGLFSGGAFAPFITGSRFQKPKSGRSGIGSLFLKPSKFVLGTYWNASVAKIFASVRVIHFLKAFRNASTRFTNASVVLIQPQFALFIF
jgi:hypothetical protein